MDDRLRSDIAEANPVADHPDEETVRLLTEMSERTRELSAGPGRPVQRAAQRPARRRRRALIPTAIVGAALLTGGAILIPLGIGTPQGLVEGDVVIPIVYTTDSGTQVSCRIAFYASDPLDDDGIVADAAVVAWAKEHDWRGIGQRIYERVRAQLDADADDGVPVPEDAGLTFLATLDRVLVEEVPPEFDLPADTPMLMPRSVTDCSGSLR